MERIRKEVHWSSFGTHWFIKQEIISKANTSPVQITPKFSEIIWGFYVTGIIATAGKRVFMVFVLVQLIPKSKYKQKKVIDKMSAVPQVAAHSWSLTVKDAGRKAQQESSGPQRMTSRESSMLGVMSHSSVCIFLDQQFFFNLKKIFSLLFMSWSNYDNYMTGTLSVCVCPCSPWTFWRQWIILRHFISTLKKKFLLNLLAILLKSSVSRLFFENVLST